MVCNDSLRATEEDNEFTSFPAATELSIVGCSMSAIGCIITFITYCLFPSLRNIPGKIVMNLSVALAIAEIILALSSFFAFHELTCKIAGMNKHFWWIATFCWMNILAYDLSKTFSNLSKIPAMINARKKILMYCLYGWGLPVIYTTACIIVDFLNIEGGFHFGGAEEGICWMKTNMDLFLTFGVPVIVFLILNIVFFVRCVVGLCLAMKVARKAKKSSSHKSDAMNLLLYIRIASVMGFNWFFAVLLGWVDEPALFYLHVFFNSLQGIFIFTCFCANKRVWNMYKELIFQQISATRIKSDSDTSKSSSSISNGTISVTMSTKSKSQSSDLNPVQTTNSRI